MRAWAPHGDAEKWDTDWLGLSGLPLGSQPALRPSVSPAEEQRSRPAAEKLSQPAGRRDRAREGQSERGTEREGPRERPGKDGKAQGWEMFWQLCGERNSEARVMRVGGGKKKMLVSMEMPLDPLFVKLPKYTHAGFVRKYKMYPIAVHPHPGTQPWGLWSEHRSIIGKGRGGRAGLSPER